MLRHISYPLFWPLPNERRKEENFKWTSFPPELLQSRAAAHTRMMGRSAQKWITSFSSCSFHDTVTDIWRDRRTLEREASLAKGIHTCFHFAWVWRQEVKDEGKAVQDWADVAKTGESWKIRKKVYFPLKSIKILTKDQGLHCFRFEKKKKTKRE